MFNLNPSLAKKNGKKLSGFFKQNLLWMDRLNSEESSSGTGSVLINFQHSWNSSVKYKRQNERLAWMKNGKRS